MGAGTGAKPSPDWVQADLYPGPNIDLVFDLEQASWPVADNSVIEFCASHVLEHLGDPFTFFKELWRVCAPQASILIRVPHGSHRAAWFDLTHKRPWFAESFAFLQPGYAESIGNPQHTEWTAYFGIGRADQRISAKFAPYLRWRWQRKLFCFWLDNIAEAIEELWVWMYPIKTEEALQTFLKERPGNYVPARYVVYQHALEGRILRYREPSLLVPLTEHTVVNGFHDWRSFRSWRWWRNVEAEE